MKNKLPRKLKKELCKIDCIERQRMIPTISGSQNPFLNDSLTMLLPKSKIRLKKGVKVNKWTKLLINKWESEMTRNFQSMMKRELRSISPEQFQREYMNEPIPKTNPSKAIDTERLEIFRRECIRQGKLISMPFPPTIESIPRAKPDHRLHRHPKMEMYYCREDEVIVDVEFVNEFTHRPLYNGKNGEIDPNHIIVPKHEYFDKIEDYDYRS